MKSERVNVEFRFCVGGAEGPVGWKAEGMEDGGILLEVGARAARCEQRERAATQREGKGARRGAEVARKRAARKRAAVCGNRASGSFKRRSRRTTGRVAPSMVSVDSAGELARKLALALSSVEECAGGSLADASKAICMSAVSAMAARLSTWAGVGEERVEEGDPAWLAHPG